MQPPGVSSQKARAITPDSNHSGARRPRLLYFISEDWFFLSHFLERAVAARDAGYDVGVALNCDPAKPDRARIEAAGIRVIPLPLKRASLNPLTELRTLLAIGRLYRAERPDLLHQAALKPVLYGSIAARLAGIRNLVNAPIGMGFVFSSDRPLARILRPAVRLLLALLLNPRGSKVVFENGDDRRELIRLKCVREADALLIRGAGVDTTAIVPPPVPPPPLPVVVLVARMLADKGVREFVAAARQLRADRAPCRFQLIGAPDRHNRASIPEAELAGWQEEGVVEWLGHRTDVPDLLQRAHIACLPSYREGLPKSLIEAMAAGLPIVTTDVPGCREVVTDGRNGLLVPPRDAGALASALRRLIANPDEAKRMGRESRRRAETEFASSVVCAQTIALYRTFVAPIGVEARASSLGISDGGVGGAGQVP